MGSINHYASGNQGFYCWKQQTVLSVFMDLTGVSYSMALLPGQRWPYALPSRPCAVFSTGAFENKRHRPRHADFTAFRGLGHDGT